MKYCYRKDNNYFCKNILIKNKNEKVYITFFIMPQLASNPNNTEIKFNF